MRIEHLADLPVIRVHRHEPITKPLKPLGREPERVGVPVDPDHAGRASLQQRPRVSSEPQRAIDEDAAAFWLQELERLLEQHGLMCRWSLVSSLVVVRRVSSRDLRPTDLPTIC